MPEISKPSPAPARPAPVPRPPAAAPAPAAPLLERLSLERWAERRWTDPAERKAKAWLLAMVAHRRARAEAATGAAPADLTEAEFDEAMAAAGGHKVEQHHTPQEKE